MAATRLGRGAIPAAEMVWPRNSSDGLLNSHFSTFAWGGLLYPAEGPVDEPLEGVQVYSNRPNGVMMAVLGMSAAFMGTWWYPFFRSILEKCVHPAALAAKSSMLGTG